MASVFHRCCAGALLFLARCHRSHHHQLDAVLVLRIGGQKAGVEVRPEFPIHAIKNIEPGRKMGEAEQIAIAKSSCLARQSACPSKPQILWH